MCCLDGAEIKLDAIAALGRWMPGNTLFLWVQIVMLRHCQSELASLSRSSDLPFTYFLCALDLESELLLGANSKGSDSYCQVFSYEVN